MMNGYVSVFSQLYHFCAYSIEKPKMQLEKSMFIMSIDVDVGSPELGVINKGENDANIRRHTSECKVGEIEEVALPLFLDILNDFQMVATFAIRGQLTEINDSILKLVLESPLKQDIGAHGYYHRDFTSLSCSEAAKELNMISEGMNKFGIVPKSFVFPRNRVAHLDILEKYGYKCYRSRGNFMNDRMYINKKGQLYEIHPSLFLAEGVSLMLIKKIIDIAIAKKLPFHVWFHLWNFGETRETIKRNLKNILLPLFKYTKKKEKNGMLTFETMLSAAKKVELMSIGD